MARKGDTKPLCHVAQMIVALSGVNLWPLSGGKSLVLWQGAWGTACKHPVQRPGASPHNEERERHANHEHVILETLPRLGPSPVHKETVAPMHSDHSDEHLTDEAQGDHPREEPHG